MIPSPVMTTLGTLFCVVVIRLGRFSSLVAPTFPKVTSEGNAKYQGVRKSVLILLLLVFGACRLTASAEEETSLLLSPPPQGQVSSNDLIVSVSLSGPLGKAMDLETAKLFVDGRNVTGLCLRTGEYLSFRPLSPLQPGKVSARVEFSNGVTREWSFQVIPSQLIKSVTHNAQEALGEYQEMKVEMDAEPGLEAGFLIDHRSEEYPMTETSRGHYEGIYTVQPGDYFLGVPITGQLHLGERVESRDSESLANLFGHLFRVHIIEPLSGKAPSNDFMIKGRTRPKSKVTIVPRLSFNNNTAPPASRWSDSGGGSIEAQADDEGYFQIEYGVPVSVPGLNVVLSVFAVTPSGERSVPITLRYSF